MATSVIKNGIKATTKSWSGKSMAQGADYVTMASFNVPAGARVLIIGTSGNGLSKTQKNVCSIFLGSGTAKTNVYGAPTNDSGSGNFAIGWMYLEAETNCVVNVRQYAYTGDAVTNANGRVVAISLDGPMAT